MVKPNHTIDFSVLFDRIAPVLRRIVSRIRYQGSSLSIEDLYQEASLHLWQDYNAGKLSDKTDSYVLQGCYFYLKNYLRTHGVRRKVISFQDLTGEDGQPAEEFISSQDESLPDSRNRLDTKLLAETILNNGFTPREKEAMSLFSDSLTMRQIGVKMGVSHVMVVKMMAKIKEKCRQYADTE